MKRLTLVILLFGLLTLVYVPSALANGVYFSKIPEGLTKDCTLCHTSIPSLNEFGQNFKAHNYDFAAISGGTGKDPQAKDPQAKDPDPVKVEGEPQTKQVAKIELFIPDSIARGEKSQLQAKVTVDGKPLKGKQVDFFEKTDFFGQGKMNIGTASTAADGIAEIKYWPSAAAEKVNVIASVDKEAIQAAGSIALVAAGPIYHIEEGLKVPFLGTWTIGLVVGAIWATYFFAGYNVLQIRRYAKAEEQEVILEDERTQAQA